jgi:hypothetical protein
MFICTPWFTIICQRSILYRANWNHANIEELNSSRWRVRPFATGKEKWICICWMFLMSYDDCSWARRIGMPYIWESTSNTLTLIFPSLTWELILIDDTTLLKDHKYIHSRYMDRCTIVQISWYLGKKDRGTYISTSMTWMRPSDTEFKLTKSWWSSN